MELKLKSRSDVEFLSSINWVITRSINWVSEKLWWGSDNRGCAIAPISTAVNIWR